jgi:cysteine-rich repeat protein
VDNASTMVRDLRLLVTTVFGLSVPIGCTPATPSPFESFTTQLPMTSTSDESDGDGDGDPGDGDGDSGDGDGDGDSGDGDGDGDSGDGDGDGDPGPSCGDGVVDPGEECDVGNETMFCDADCTYVMCGDGYWNMLSEACDDGNADNTDGCVGACVVNVCGDGILWEGQEQCDDANMIDVDECKNDCTPAACGDGVIWEEFETCDDQNMVDADACTNACQIAACGDGILWPDMEICDDGNFEDDDQCPSSCEPAVCGDGFVLAGAEDCDDGNDVDDDFCANDCTANTCQPSGVRAPLNTLNIDTASGCWNGNPCSYDIYQWNQTHGQSFLGFGQAMSCTGAPTCVANVGITTYDGSVTQCQGTWDVYCDNELLGTVDTNGKTCTGSAMANTCRISFPGRVCGEIELRSAQDNNANGACCGGGEPDSMVTGVSAW